MHHRLGSMTVAAGFPQGKQLEFPMEEIPLGQYSCKKKKSERSHLKRILERDERKKQQQPLVVSSSFSVPPLSEIHAICQLCVTEFMHATTAQTLMWKDRI